jgi:hypothetical protein
MALFDELRVRLGVVECNGVLNSEPGKRNVGPRAAGAEAATVAAEVTLGHWRLAGRNWHWPGKILGHASDATFKFAAALEIGNPA